MQDTSLCYRIEHTILKFIDNAVWVPYCTDQANLENHLPQDLGVEGLTSTLAGGLTR